MVRKMNFSDLSPEQLQRIYIRDELLKMAGEKWKEKKDTPDVYYAFSFQQWYGVFDLPILIEEELVVHLRDKDVTMTQSAGPLLPFNYEITPKGYNVLTYTNSWILIGNFHGVDIIPKDPNKPWTDAERAEWLRKQGTQIPKEKPKEDPLKDTTDGWQSEFFHWTGDKANRSAKSKVPPAGADNTYEADHLRWAKFDPATGTYSEDTPFTTARASPRSGNLNDKEKRDFQDAWEKVTQSAKKTGDAFTGFNDIFEGGDFHFGNMTEEQVLQFLKSFWGFDKNGRKKK